MQEHDVAGVSIRGMVIVFYVLGSSDELGVKLPETAEDRSSLNFIDWPYCHPDIFCTVFHHVCLFHRNRLVRPVWSLFVTTIYRSGVFGHCNIYALTVVNRCCVFCLLCLSFAREPCGSTVMITVLNHNL